MGKNIIYKILEAHLEKGNLKQGEEIVVKVDMTMSHDLSSIVVAQAFEAVGADKVKTEKSVFICDHNVLCTSEDNSNDHYYMRTSAERFGCYFSRPGNGICHTIMCERFAAPGKLIIGGDSHTPTSGAVGALAIGSGGVSVAKAALGQGFRFKVPKIMGVKLTGRLKTGVSAKDIALELLRIVTVKGALGYIIEYFGDGAESLSVTERMTISNMSIEMGATSGVFICDEVTREFMKAQGREDEYREQFPDADAEYDTLIEINLDELEPLASCPHSPDNVKKVSESADVRPGSVFIGSCTNSSYSDLARAAAVMKGKKIDSAVDCVVAAGSRAIYEKLLDDGIIDTLVKAGCRVLECACGPCIGIGQVPRYNGITVRTSNRNFPGRSGTNDAGVYLVSPETAAATAIAGHLECALNVTSAESLEAVYTGPIQNIDDTLLIPPLTDDEERRKVVPVKGPNVSDLPMPEECPETIEAPVILHLGDNITTDDIIPGGAAIVKHIANVPKFAEYCFCYTDPDFVKRAKEMKHSIIVGGENYGQGSSREQAAILPLYLGVQAVIAKSFARIHKENLVNWSILPLQFSDKEAYEKLERDDRLVIRNVKEGIKKGRLTVEIPEKGYSFEAVLDVSDDDKEILMAGGALRLMSE